MKILGKNKTRLLPSDWDEDEEYIFDDEYDSDDEEEDDNEIELDDRFENINEAELDELKTDENIAENNNNNNNNNALNVNDENEAEQGNNEAAAQALAPIAEAEDENDEAPDLIPADNDDSDDEDDDDDDAEDKNASVASNATRSGRVSNQPDRLTYNDLGETHNQSNADGQPIKKKEKNNKKVRFQDAEDAAQDAKIEMLHNIITEDIGLGDVLEYNPDLAPVMAQLISDIHGGIQRRGMEFVESFAQQYVLERGLKKFGERGDEATFKELEQLHKRTCFTPIDISKMTSSEKQRAQRAILLLTEKRDETIKGRMVFNGKGTRDWLTKEETSSPAVSTEAVMMTATIDAKEQRDIMSIDLPNAYIQAEVPDDAKPKDPETGEPEQIIMKIVGRLVDYLVKVAPEIYGPYVVFENGKKVLYVEVLRGIYGMLISGVLWYKKFRRDLEGTGFKFNPYDPCVANRIVKKKQHTIRMHVDDVMSSHINPTVNDEFYDWCVKKYGDKGKVKCTRGKLHDYLGMKFDFSRKEEVDVDMTEYMKKMYVKFSAKYTLNNTATTPASNDLFGKDPNSPKLNKEMADDFHTYTAKGLFAAKRARPDTGTSIAVLTTRVRAPTVEDWGKLVRYMQYVKRTWKYVMTLSADSLHVLKWYVDASFAVHPDFRSHTGAILTMGKGAQIAVSAKQKLNSKSSCISELIGCDDASTLILWSRLFMNAQGYEIEKNILYQDNKSTILFLENGRKSVTKRTRAINIRYFFLADQREKGNIMVEWCPTNKMLGDPMTKPLQGASFKNMSDLLMGRKHMSET